MSVQTMYNRVTRRTLADVVDDTRTVTVLETMANPRLSITNVIAPSEALPGTLIDVQVFFSVADGDGLAWGQIFDADTPIVPVSARLEWDVWEGMTASVIFTGLVMPNRDWNLLIRVGHVE